MSSSLSCLVDNLAKGFQNNKCRKYESFFEYISIKDNKLIGKRIYCNKSYKLHFNKDLISRFANTYEFCDEDINRFILLFEKEFIHMNTSIAGKDLMKHHCLIKKFFTVV